MTGETTGFYGDQTKAAVAKFQTVVGLESTGVYDNTTRSKLEASDAPSNPEAAVIKKGDAVRSHRAAKPPDPAALYDRRRFRNL